MGVYLPSMAATVVLLLKTKLQTPLSPSQYSHAFVLKYTNI